MKQTLIDWIRAFFLVGTPRAIKRGMLCRVTFAVLACMGSGSGYAFVLRCDGGGGTTTVTARDQISVSPNDPKGKLLTEWFEGPKDTLAFNCDVAKTTTVNNRITATPSGQDTGMRIDGLYPVYTTNIEGIGIAVGARVYFKRANTEEWKDWMLDNAYPTLTMVPIYVNRGQKLFLGGQVRYALVKTVEGRVKAGKIESAASTITLDMTPPADEGTWKPQKYELSPIIVESKTCQTPDVKVDMGTVLAKDFQGQGSIVRRTPFKIELQNCSASIQSIQYTLEPVNPLIPGTQSVIALNSGGATGVGLQLQDAQGSPVPLNKPVSFPGYTPGGSASIPLQAAYYQTASKITGGKADAEVKFTITYQ